MLRVPEMDGLYSLPSPTLLPKHKSHQKKKGPTDGSAKQTRSRPEWPHVLDDSPGSTLVRLLTNTPTKAEPPPWSNEPRGGLESGDPIGSTDPKRGPATDARTDEKWPTT